MSMYVRIYAYICMCMYMYGPAHAGVYAYVHTHLYMYASAPASVAGLALGEGAPLLVCRRGGVHSRRIAANRAGVAPLRPHDVRADDVRDAVLRAPGGPR